MNTVKVKSWGKDQGDFVLIEKDSFDPAVHQIYDETPAGEKSEQKAPTVAELRAALEAKGIDIPAGANKAALQALLDETPAGEKE